MTNKIYRTAAGKTVDIGALILQNEQVRAVGNMRVNARGDLLDSNNQIIDEKNQQITRQVRRQSNVSNQPIQNGTRDVKPAPRAESTLPPEPQQPVLATGGARQVRQTATSDNLVDPADTFADLPEEAPSTNEFEGGLGQAIARARQTKRETQPAAKPTVRKI